MSRHIDPAPLSHAVPAGFPTLLDGPLVWTGRILEQNADNYIWQLSKDEQLDISSGLDHFKALCLPRGAVDKITFPLSPDFSAKLKNISDVVHNGHGFIVLKGLQPCHYSEEDNVLVYAGLTSHVAGKRTRMKQAYNRAKRTSHERLPPHLQAGPMSFHTDVDQGDMLSIYIVNVGKAGGAQYIASFWQIYNSLVQHAPDVLASLAKDWRWELPSPSGGIEIVNRPIMYCVDGRVELTFGRSFLTKSPLSTEQAKAIDVLIAACQGNCVKLTPSSGDILFANNLGLLHARDEFVDDSSIGKCRHLLGVLLQDSDWAWPLPEVIERRLKNEFSGSRDDFDSVIEEWQRCISSGRGPVASQ